VTVLETLRLILRPFQPDDLDQLAELTANQDFMRFSLGPYDRTKTEVFLNKILRYEREGLPSLLAVTIRPDPTVVGYCGFYHHPEHGIEDVEIGYRLNPNYWNRSLITEGARAVRDHGFAVLKLPRVISLIHPENIPSRRVAEKNGMTVEKEIMFRGLPTLIFSMTREQWLALSAS
jgi:RimJ/RimL family protein N-acetyltransferase